MGFTEARDSEWQWHQLSRMQVCTSLQTDNHACTPPLSFFTGRMPVLPTNQYINCWKRPPQKRCYPWGHLSPHLIMHGPLVSPKSIPQSAPSSIHPFLRGLRLCPTDRNTHTDHATLAAAASLHCMHAMHPNNKQQPWTHDTECILRPLQPRQSELIRVGREQQTARPADRRVSASSGVTA